LASETFGHRQHREEFAREAELATTVKDEAIIDIAVKWTARRLRQMM